MEPISLIIAAITAGATAAAQDTTSAIVRDAYQGLKRMILRRCGGSPEAQEELARQERELDSDPAGLAERLRAAGADRDEELVAAAQGLLETVDPAGARAHKYSVSISGGKGVVVGDHATTTMNFDDRD
ncbi:hypothetical protein [Couchioplanes azureus]|uniref:hypothetical protein n=1 Tax=Couchioplanes caeruleus TaxID=56438 RepID=UPI00166F671C|nr:hypothetical protein [Couchioplanes caeruleus]GGQ74749.1 hypothetical protein GCM10010166_50860 [Couchioplanes caeruleus subsp. azureus]